MLSWLLLIHRLLLTKNKLKIETKNIRMPIVQKIDQLLKVQTEFNAASFYFTVFMLYFTHTDIDCVATQLHGSNNIVILPHNTSAQDAYLLPHL